MGQFTDHALKALELTLAIGYGVLRSPVCLSVTLVMYA